MDRLRQISLALWLGALLAGFAMFATPVETPRVSAAVRGPLVPDAVQCTGTKLGDCRSYVAQPEDGNKILRATGDGLQMLWMNSPNFPLVPPGALVSNATLIVRAMEVNTSANLAVRVPDDGTPIATAIGSASAVETRELTGPSLVSTVRDAVRSGKDLSLQLSISPPSGATSPALEIDFVALSIEYQPGALTVIPSPSPTATTGGPNLVSPTVTPTVISGTATAVSGTTNTNGNSGGGSGSGQNSSQSGTSATGASNGGVMTMANAAWLDLPPAVPSARADCPANGIWALLYWNGPNDTPIVAASPICANGDRFWVFRNGRWQGYSPLFPTASDSWTALSGEAHFVRGRSF